MENREEELEKLLQNKELVEELLAKQEPHEAQKFFEDHGIVFTMDEVRSMGETLGMIARKAADHGGELSEEELDEVSGGFVISTGAILTILALVGPTAAMSAVFKWKW